MSLLCILNNWSQRKLSKRRRFKRDQQVKLMRRLKRECEIYFHSFSLFFIVCIFMRRAFWKATFQIKEMWDLFLLSSLFCLNTNTKVKFAMSHFLWIMKCNLREQIPKQVSYLNKSQCFLRRISSHNPWSSRLETYKVFFEFIWPVMSYFFISA